MRGWLEDFAQDLRFGTRALARRPGFALLATGVLALGIGAPTTVLTMVNAIYLERPSGVAEPHRLVRLVRSHPSYESATFGHPNYAYYRERTRTLGGLAAWGRPEAASYRLGSGEPGQLMLSYASDNYFDVLGVRPSLGRAFATDESTTPGTHPVAVLSHGFWVRTGASPDAVGETLSLNGIPFTVVGVAPEGFRWHRTRRARAGRLGAHRHVRCSEPLSRDVLVGARPEDGPDAPPVVVVNQALAGRLWPGEDPLGRVLALGDAERTVVGVARDATYYELGEEARSQAYVSELQLYQPLVHFLVRSAGESAPTLAAVQSVLREIDPTLAFGRTTTLESLVDDETARYEVSAILVGLFGLIALALAAVGLYGVIAHLVAGRTREIGVRMALGAGRSTVARNVLRSAFALSGSGVLLGLFGALALGGLTESLLYRVEPGDPLPLIAGGLTLLAVTLLAAAGPALRATRVDPASAMRRD